MTKERLKTRIKDLKKIHGEKFNYDNYSEIADSGRIENVFCNKHRLFFSCSLSTHKKSHGGCPKCRYEEKTTEFIKKYGKPEYDYSESSFDGALIPMKIRCKKHNHVFMQKPSYHKTKMGICPKCVSDNKIKRFIDKAQKKHGTQYDYSMLEKIEDFNILKPVPIICKTHGLFTQNAAQHLCYDVPCKLCPKETRKIVMWTMEEFIVKAQEKFKDKYDYSLVAIKSMADKVKIICPTHGIFEKRPYDFIFKSHGCPKCIKNSFISNSETKWLNSLRVPLRTCVLEGYIVDGFDDLKKTIYEFLGDYWHGNPEVHDKAEMNRSVNQTFGELHQKTFERLNELKSKGYKVIYIWENDWKQGKPEREL